MADVLKKAGVPVVVHPTMQRPGSMETYNSHLGNAAVLAEHKIPLAIGSGVEGYVPKTRVVRFEAAVAMVHGLGFERALRAITLDAAGILGIADRFGSLETGKAADLVLYDGDAFDTARTSRTRSSAAGWSTTGRRISSSVRPAALPATGGGGVGCCLGAW